MRLFLVELTINNQLARKGKQKGRNKGKNDVDDKKGAPPSITDEISNKDDISDLIDDNQERDAHFMEEFIKIPSFTIHLGGKDLFKNASISLNPGHKYGLVGINGCGKSTLMKAIATKEAEFSNIPGHFDIHLVEQEVEGDDVSALDSVINADVKRLRLLEEEKRLLSVDDDDEVGEKLGKIYDELDFIEADTAEGRAASILTGLQFDDTMKQKPTKEFSGGWRMRIALAKALFRRPTLLLLDEPTNHLDLNAVIWLQAYLKSWKNILVVVSHDQDFLNTVCSDILHCFQEKLDHYRGAEGQGSYDVYKKVFDEKLSNQTKAYEKQEKQRKQAQKANKSKQEREKEAQKKAGRTVEKRGGGGKGKKGRGGDREDQNDMLDENNLIKKPPKAYDVQFEFPEPGDLSFPVIQINEASFGYPEAQPIFTDLNFGIDLDSKIALIGPNGCGKTTLLKLIKGDLEASTGDIIINRKLITAHFSQHFVEQLDMKLSPVGYLQSKWPEYTEAELRKFIGRFGLTGQTQVQPIQLCSGGQKSRVVMSEICMKNPHLLLLDEPTNHLDIESIEALTESLSEFEGGFVLVSHDIRLISEVCEQIWIVGDQGYEVFDGDFADYKSNLMDEYEEAQLKEAEDRAVKQAQRRAEREAIRLQIEEKKNASKK